MTESFFIENTLIECSSGSVIKIFDVHYSIFNATDQERITKRKSLRHLMRGYLRSHGLTEPSLEMQPKSIALLKKVDSTIYQILEKFQDLFEKAVIDEKPKEVLAVENAAMEFDAQTIIRLCKDLLGITRGLRETWCLETIKATPSSETNKEAEDEATREVFMKFNQLIDRIASLKGDSALKSIV